MHKSYERDEYTNSDAAESRNRWKPVLRFVENHPGAAGEFISNRSRRKPLKISRGRNLFAASGVVPLEKPVLWQDGFFIDTAYDYCLINRFCRVQYGSKRLCKVA